MRNNLISVIQVAAVYVGTVVGAGFATGKEIVTFFSQYGLYGLGAIFISSFLLMYFGGKLLTTAAIIKAKSYWDVTNYLFGRKFANIINVILLLMLLGVSSVMLSGAGALFAEQFLVSRQIGIIITLLLVTYIIIVGVKGILAVNIFFVPMMIVFTVMLMFASVKNPAFFENVINIPEQTSVWKPMFLSFSYVAFNLAVAQAALVPIAKNVKNEAVLKWGGYVGGALLSVILVASHLTLIMLPNFEKYEIPMAMIMNQVAPKLFIVYLIVIFAEIFTSLVGNVFGIEQHLITTFPRYRLQIIVVTLLIIALISKINYGDLLAFLYPLFGYISLLFLFILAIKDPANNKKRQ